VSRATGCDHWYAYAVGRAVLNKKLNTNKSLKQVLGTKYLFCADTATLFQFVGIPNHVPDNFSQTPKRPIFI